MKLLAVITMALLLSGCTTYRTEAGYDGLNRTPLRGQTIHRQVHALHGKPQNDAFLMLGKPSGQYTRGDVTTYVWQRRASDSVFGPRVTRGAGLQLGRRMHMGSAFMMSGIEYYRCIIKAATQDGIIRKIWLEENPGGCRFIYENERHGRLGFESLAYR